VAQELYYQARAPEYFGDLVRQFNPGGQWRSVAFMAGR
jgi:hypothetical protein